MNLIDYIRFLILPSWRLNSKLVALSVLSIALGVALIVSVFNSNESILEQFNYSNTLIQGEQSAKFVSVANSFNESQLTPLLLRQIANFDYTPVLERKLLNPQTGQIITVLGVDLLNDYRFRKYAFDKENPKIISLLNPEEGGLLLSEIARKKLKIESNKLDLLYGDKTLSFRVAEVGLKNIGIAKAEGGLIAITDLKYLQAMLSEPGMYSALEFKGTVPEILKTALSIPSGFRIVDPSARRAEIKSLTAAFRFNLQALSFIALLVAVYLIFQTIFISFQRKTRSIGTLRVLGFSSLQSFQLLMTEAFLIGIIGVVLGCFLGSFLSHFVLQSLQKTVNELYFSVNSAGLLFSPKGFWIASTVGILSSLLAGVPSSIMALGVQPAVNLKGIAFRNLQNISVWGLNSLYSFGGFILIFLFLFQEKLFQIPSRYLGFAMAFLALVGLGLIAGFFLESILKYFNSLSGWFGKLLSVRLSVNFVRLWIATGALICGLSMTIAISVMIDSFRNTVKDWINDTLKADIYISALYQNEEGLNPKIIQGAALLEGVKEIDFLSRHRASYKNKPAIIGGANLALQSKTLKFIQKEPELEQKILNENYVFVSNTFAQKQSLKAGSQINLNTYLGESKFKIAGVYQDYSSEHGYILMRRALYLEHFKNPKITNIALYLSKESNLDAIRNQIISLAGDKVKVQTNSELRKTVLSIFDQTFQISYLFFWIALTIAILTVSLTLFSCIEENTYLNLINRYLGTTIFQLFSLEIAQGLLITFVSLLLSIPGGYWLSYILQNTVNNQSFGWIVYLHPNWYIFAFISVLALTGALIGSIYPLWIRRKIFVSNALLRD